MRNTNFKRVSVIFAFCVFLFLIFVLALFPYAPLQDLPEWVYQGYLFNELISGKPSSEFALTTYPVPYALFQLTTSAVLLLFSPMMTSKIVVIIYGLLVLLAIHLFISRAKIDPLVGWVFLTSVAALNSPFWNGYMGYQFGLIVLLFYLSLSSEARTEVFPLLLFSLLAFFSHGIIYASILVFAGIFSLYNRRIFQCALGLLPSLCLVVWYKLKNRSTGEMNELFQLHDVNTVAYKIYSLLKAAPYHNAILSNFNSVEYFGSLYIILGMLIDAIFMLSLGMLAYAAVTRSSLRAIALKPEFVIAAILLLVAIALPPAVLGIANPGERLTYPALIAFAMAVYTGPELPLVPKVTLTAALIAGYGLLALALIPASGLYREMNKGYKPGDLEKNESSILEPWETQRKISSSYLFGHRFMQYDDKMKKLEEAWRMSTMPAIPLAFDTALIVAKGK
jgi:hypothetical protein